MLSPQRVVDNIKKMRFIKEQEASGLLSSLEIKIPILSNLHLAGDILL